MNYEFDARTADTAALEAHLENLSKGFECLFADIDISQLKLDSEAVNILTSACQVVHETILRYDPEKPFYLMLGEEHTTPAHKLHHMVVMKGLLAEGFNLSVGQELRENIWILWSAKYLGYDPHDQKVRQIIENYSQTHPDFLPLLSFLGGGKVYAPYTDKFVERFLLEHQDRMTTYFIDAPNRIDPETGQEIHEIDTSNLPEALQKGNNQPNIDGKSREGMEIRDQYMLGRVQQINNDNRPIKTKHITVGIVRNYHIINQDRTRNSPGQINLAAELYPDLNVLSHTYTYKWSQKKLEAASDSILVSPYLSKAGRVIFSSLLYSDEFFNLVEQGKEGPTMTGPFGQDLDFISHLISRPFIETLRFEGEKIGHAREIDTKMQTLGLGAVIPEDPQKDFNELKEALQKHGEALKENIEAALAALEQEQKTSGNTAAMNVTPAPV